MQLASLEEVIAIEAEQSPVDSGIVDASGKRILRDNVGHYTLDNSVIGAEKGYVRLHTEPEDMPLHHAPLRVPSFHTLAKAAAFIAVIGAAYFMTPSAQAAPLGNPLLALPSSSTPAYGFAKPAALASLTGADSDISMNGYWVIDQNGIAAYFTGFQSTPARMVEPIPKPFLGCRVTAVRLFSS